MEVRDVDGIEMPRSGARELFDPAGFRPVRAIGARRFGLWPDHLAPHAAHEAEAIASNPAQRGLMAIGRADPGARGGDDLRACE